MPERTCRVCRTQRPKPELVRWVMRDDGLAQDPNQSSSGRGYYSCAGTCSDKITKFKIKLKVKSK